MTHSSIKAQEPFLYKLKSGLVKFINRRRHSSIVHTFRPSKHHHYSPTRQGSFDTHINNISNTNYYDDNDTDNDDDDLDSSSITRVNSELQHSAYSKDDDFERNRYNGNKTNSQHQHSRRPSAISIQSPPSILVKRSPTPSSHHRHTKSLQNASVISLSSTSNNNNTGKPAHYHHSRHYSHISCISASNMTVNSEDLTAKEFADMAGIKILPDDDDENDRQHDDNNGATSTMATSITNRTQQHPHQRQHRPTSSASSIMTTNGGYGHRPCYFSYHAGDENDWSVVSSGSMQSQQSGSAKIWDTGFWRRPSMDNTNTNVDGATGATAAPNSTFTSGKPPLPPHTTSTTSTTGTTIPQQQQQQQHQFQHQQQQHPLLPPLPANGKAPPLRKHRSALLQHRQTLSLPPPIPPVTTNKMQCQHAKSKSTCDLPIVDELRRIHSLSSNNQQPHGSNNSNNDHRVIRKGRFEIQLESSCPPLQAPPPPASSIIDTKSTPSL